MKIRLFTLLISLAVISFGVYIFWLAYSILSPTPFNLAATALLTAATVGVIIWFFLIAIRRRSFRRKPEHLKQYRVEHGIGAKQARLKKI